MKYYALKPLYLTETDWAPMVKNPKDFSFSPEMVEKKTVLDLPENDFIHGLAAEKLLVAAENPRRSGRKANTDSAEPLDEGPAESQDEEANE